MKNIITSLIIATIALAGLTCCHHSTLEDRAEKDANDYTRRYCPTPYTDNQRTDSITFTRYDKTFHYYYTLQGNADNTEIIQQNKDKLRQVLQEELNSNTQSKAYKEAGYRFHYVFRSASTGKILLEQILKAKQ